MAKRGKPNPDIENTILAALAARGDLAVNEDDLKFLSGIHGLSFKEAIIRLVRKGLIVKWKSENYVNYLALAERADSAYYEEKILIDPLYVAFGHCSSVVNIKRSIPFVTLHDEDLKKERLNRYRP